MISRGPFLLLLVPLLILTGCATTNPANSKEHPPVLDGGFWQLGPELLDQFTDAELAAEVAHLKDLGMDIIIIQYSVLPFWPDNRTTYTAYVENSVYTVHPAFQGRRAFESIFEAAEENDVKVILGGLLMPMPFEQDYEQGVQTWISRNAMQYRRELIQKFSEYESFYGWYTPNEPNPAALVANNADPALMKEATDTVTSFVGEQNPNLKIIKSIGLYLEPDGNGGHKFATEAYLDTFWRPWVRDIENVDVWMVIDGVGTELSNLEHTDMAQRWARSLASEFGKDFWVDVENAHMVYVDSVYTSSPFTIDELEDSLKVASRYGSRLVTFDYIHYMSLQSPKPKAKKLYNDYREYLDRLGDPESSSD